jgi:hypothetical protein
MTTNDLAVAYRQFFLKSEAGQSFVSMLETLETNAIADAQNELNLNKLAKSAGIKEVIEHIHAVVNSSEQ